MREHEASLVRYATRISGGAETARDIAQDVFLRLCREDPAELNGRLRPWLYAVCRNRAIQLRRKNAWTVSAGESQNATEPTDGVDPAQAAQNAEAGSQVSRVLAELPANQQEVLRLRFEHGLSYKEIAAVLDLTVGNVGVLIHNAIKTIRKRIE